MVFIELVFFPVTTTTTTITTKMANLTEVSGIFFYHSFLIFVCLFVCLFPLNHELYPFVHLYGFLNQSQCPPIQLKKSYKSTNIDPFMERRRRDQAEARKRLSEVVYQSHFVSMLKKKIFFFLCF